MRNFSICCSLSFFHRLFNWIVFCSVGNSGFLKNPIPRFHLSNLSTVVFPSFDSQFEFAQHISPSSCQGQFSLLFWNSFAYTLSILYVSTSTHSLKKPLHLQLSCFCINSFLFTTRSIYSPHAFLTATLSQLIRITQSSFI